MGVSLQQSYRRHDLPRLAVPALHHFMFQPCLLYRLADRLLAYRLNGGDLTTGHRADRQYTRADCLPIQVHRADATLRDTAPVLGSGQP
ncbi:hypothetical protein D3C76_1634370 [compost metagenome]